MAALLVVAGAVATGARWRWPAGAGLVLGAGVASTWGLVSLATAWTLDYRWEGGLAAGFWSLLGGHVVVLAGAAVVASQLLPGTGSSIGRPELPRAVVLSLAGAGALAGMSLVVGAGRTNGDAMYWVVPAWMAVTAAAAPVVVAFVRPGSLRVWLLVGWLLGAGAGVVMFERFQAYQGATEAARSGTWAVVAVASLVPLVVVLALLARPAPAPPAAPLVEEGSGGRPTTTSTA